jgi:hypothetical protein
MTEVFQHIGIQNKSNTLPLVTVIKWAGSALPMTQLRSLSNNRGAIKSWLMNVCISCKECSISKTPHVLTITWAITAAINIAHLFQRSTNPKHINAFAPPWCCWSTDWAHDTWAPLYVCTTSRAHHFTCAPLHVRTTSRVHHFTCAQLHFLKQAQATLWRLLIPQQKENGNRWQWAEAIATAQFL